MGGKEQKYIKEAFDTNWVAPLGPNVTGFEQDIEKYIGENLCRSLKLRNGSHPFRLDFTWSESGRRSTLSKHDFCFS
jgi:hypothetical protein